MLYADSHALYFSTTIFAFAVASYAPILSPIRRFPTIDDISLPIFADTLRRRR